MHEIPLIENEKIDTMFDNQVKLIPEPTGDSWKKKEETIEEKTQENQIIEEETIEEKSPELLDKEDLTFDERIHEKNKDGSPRNWQGKLKRKKGWQKFIDAVKEDQKKSTPPPDPEPVVHPEGQDNLSVEQLSESEPQEQEVSPEEVEKMMARFKGMSNRELAILATDTFIGVGAAKFDENEWMPIQIEDGKTDRDSIVESWEAFFIDMRAGEKIPLWAQPWLAMLSYTTTRVFTKPKTQTAFKGYLRKAKDKLKLLIAYFKGKFSRSAKVEEQVEEDA